MRTDLCIRAFSLYEWFRGLEAAIFSLEDDPARGAITPERPFPRHLLFGKRPHVYRIIYSISESEGRATSLGFYCGARQPLTPGRSGFVVDGFGVEGVLVEGDVGGFGEDFAVAGEGVG